MTGCTVDVDIREVRESNHLKNSQKLDEWLWMSQVVHKRGVRNCLNCVGGSLHLLQHVGCPTHPTCFGDKELTLQNKNKQDVPPHCFHLFNPLGLDIKRYKPLGLLFNSFWLQQTHIQSQTEPSVGGWSVLSRHGVIKPPVRGFVFLPLSAHRFPSSRKLTSLILRGVNSFWINSRWFEAMHLYSAAIQQCHVALLVFAGYESLPAHPITLALTKGFSLASFMSMRRLRPTVSR